MDSEYLMGEEKLDFRRTPFGHDKVTRIMDELSGVFNDCDILWAYAGSAALVGYGVLDCLYDIEVYVTESDVPAVLARLSQGGTKDFMFKSGGPEEVPTISLTCDGIPVKITTGAINEIEGMPLKWHLSFKEEIKNVNGLNVLALSSLTNCAELMQDETMLELIKHAECKE